MIGYTSNINDIPVDGLNDLLESVGWVRRDATVWKNIFDKAGLVVGAFDENKIVGFARTFTDGRIWAIVCDLVVRPEYRKRGIAKNLMETIKAWALKSNFKTMRLFANAKDDPGLFEFYEKLGYERMENAMRLKGLEF